MAGVIGNFDAMNVVRRRDGMAHIHWRTEADYHASHLGISENKNVKNVRVVAL
jgi:hypothetical protein